MRNSQGGEVKGNTSAAGDSEKAEDTDEEMFEDDSLSQFSDGASQDEQQTYSLEEITVTYGRPSMEIIDFFPNVEKFIHSVQKSSKWLDMSCSLNRRGSGLRSFSLN